MRCPYNLRITNISDRFILCNWKRHLGGGECWLTHLLLEHIHSTVHNFTPYFPKICFNNTFHLHLDPPRGLCSSGFPTKILYAFSSLHADYIPRSSHPPWLITWGKLRKLRIVVLPRFRTEHVQNTGQKNYCSKQLVSSLVRDFENSLPIIYSSIKQIGPISIDEQSEASTVFGRSNVENAGSNPARGMDVCLRFSVLCCHV
jgi:hypothetical protein